MSMVLDTFTSICLCVLNKGGWEIKGCTNNNNT